MDTVLLTVEKSGFGEKFVSGVGCNTTGFFGTKSEDVTSERRDTAYKWICVFDDVCLSATQFGTLVQVIRDFVLFLDEYSLCCKSWSV